MRSFSLLSFVAASLATVCRAQNYPGPGIVRGDIGVHDPTMCKDNSGTYFLFGTGPGIATFTSTDRIEFKYQGAVWPNGAATWTDKYTLKSDGDIWAPECVYVNGTFFLYYSASTFGSQNSAIFLATSSTGLPGSWTHKGLVLESAVGRSNFNAIDPNIVIVGNTWYLSLGSFWDGIQLTTVSSSTGLGAGSLSTIATRPGNVNRAVEASSIFQFDDFYYLFISWDRCCAGTSSTYNIRVGRSSSPTGPYVDAAGVALTSGGGTLVLSTHSNIIGPGGQDVYQDVDGPILVYHYYTPSGSLLGINCLSFSSGWPVVV